MEEKIDLIKIWQQLKKTIKNTFLLGLVLVIGFCAIQGARKYFRYQPLYESKLTFAVVKDRNGTNSFSYNQEATEKLVSSFHSLLSSNVLSNAICQDLGVSVIPATFRIERVGNTNFLSVYAQSPHPEEARDALESLARNYSSLSRIALNDATLSVIENPELATAPSNAVNYPKELAKAAILAVAIYLAVVVLISYTRKTITQSNDIRKYLHSQCLGMIPHMKILRKAKVPLLNSQLGKDLHLRESYHTIRLAIENDAKAKENKVYLVTSAVPHEGKSTISANIAISLANKGHHVLLLDMDLRNPSQLSYFDLNSKIPENKIVKISDMQFAYYSKVTLPTLDVFAGIKSTDMATEVLSSGNITHLIDGFRDFYDYIIIDTPPISLMADTDIVASYCDASILVIRQDFISVKSSQEAYEALQKSSPQILGCILNHTDTSTVGSYHYGYSYKYGHE